MQSAMMAFFGLRSKHKRPVPKALGLEPPLPQSRSLLLTKVPSELRQLIYHHVYGPSLIHLVKLGYRLAHIRCTRDEGNDTWDQHRHGADGLNGWPILTTHDDPNSHLLALLTTCRTVYNEALPYLLMTPTYTIWQPNIMLELPPSLLHIASLHLAITFYNWPQLAPHHSPSGMECWKQICAALAGLRQLHTLRVTISQEHFFVGPRDDETELVAGLLMPLKDAAVKGADGIFEVVVQWTLTEEEKRRLREARVPFVLTEAGERTAGGRKPGDRALALAALR